MASARSARIIVVSSESATTSDIDRSAVFATTLATRLSEQSTVLFVDASKDYMGMSYLGVRMMKASMRDMHAAAWKSVRSLGEPDYFEGNDGDTPGDIVECLSFQSNGASSDAKIILMTNTSEDIVKLFRIAEDAFDYIIVLAPLTQNRNPLNGFLNFADYFFSVNRSMDEIGYKRLLSNVNYINPKTLPITVFYGTSPYTESSWINNNTALVIGMTWQDTQMTALVDRLHKERSAKNPHAVITTSSRSTKTVATGQRPKWGWSGKRFVVAALATAPTVAFVTLSTSLLDPYGFLAVPVGAAVAIVSSFRKKTPVVNAEIPAASQLEENGVYASAWEDVANRHKVVVDSWLNYELDVSLSLSYPAMLDHTVEATAALHKALGAAQVLESTKDYSVNPMEAPYGKAVQELELAYKIAEDNARKMGRSVWTPEERPQIEHAERLFAIALSDSASTQERKNAYKQALRSLEGLVAVPKKATERIEAAIALIEAAPVAKEEIVMEESK